MEKGTGTTAGEALRSVFTELSGAGVPEARTEAEFILMHVLGAKRHELFLDAMRELTADEEKGLEEIVRRRIAREPSQYIFGEAWFRGLELKVTKDVLIPRPETELLVDEAVKVAGQLKGEIRLIDLCTGSGCIAVAAAREIPGSIVYASDISPAALEVARENAHRAGVADRVQFFQGDLFGALSSELRGQVNMVLSNPPYIAEAEIKTLEPEVKDFEPLWALSGGPDGLDFIKKIINEAWGFLVPGGVLLMEMGYGQANAVKGLAESSGAYENIEIIKDYGKIERILKAGRKA